MKKIKNILLITICLFPLNVFAGSNDCVEIFGKNSQTLEYLQDIYSKVFSTNNTFSYEC